MLAAFLGLRLYSVLGKRTGHEQEPLQGRADRMPESRREQPLPVNAERRPVEPIRPAETPVHPTVYDPSCEIGVRQILAADRTLDLGGFMEGAKAAYGMILEAFWKGDREALRELCDDDVYESFETAIIAREEHGETMDNRLVRIERAQIVEAELVEGSAFLTIQFDADIAAVTRNRDGEVIAGSLTDAVDTHDVWTFARDLRSASPDWQLVSTDQA